MKTKDLIIIDLSSAIVHTYKVSSIKEVNDEYIKSLGFKLTEVDWAIGDFEFIEHQGILL